MNTEFVNAHCAALRGAESDTPFGPDTQVWKVGGKMFAAFANDGSGVSIRCRDPHTASLLIKLGKATQPPYLRDEGWVMIGWNTRRDELEDRLTTSYETVRSELKPSARLNVSHSDA